MFPDFPQTASANDEQRADSIRKLKQKLIQEINDAREHGLSVVLLTDTMAGELEGYLQFDLEIARKY